MDETVQTITGNSHDYNKYESTTNLVIVTLGEFIYRLVVTLHNKTQFTITNMDFENPHRNW